MTADEVAKDIVDAALKVHRALGPGLLESAYQACLAHDLQDVGTASNAKSLFRWSLTECLLKWVTASTCESIGWFG
jgi:GxxExxY protein